MAYRPKCLVDTPFPNFLHRQLPDFVRAFSDQSLRAQRRGIKPVAISKEEVGLNTPLTTNEAATGSRTQAPPPRLN